LKQRQSNSSVLIICGPTAVGKSELALLIARKIGGEIISADAFQFYRGLDIGTAKPGISERQEVPHHLIDCLSPEERANAHWYAEKVRSLIPEILARRRTPILVGGSGLYLKSVLDWFFDLPDQNKILKAREEIKDLSADELLVRLQKVDPESACRIHPHDTYRLLRALEIYLATGQSATIFRRQNRPFPYTFYLIGVYRSRDELYRRIEERVNRILESGFLEEVKVLKDHYDFSLPAFEAIGYREAAEYLSGKISRQELKRMVIHKTKDYVRRQMTWFRKDKRIVWLNLTGR